VEGVPSTIDDLSGIQKSAERPYHITVNHAWVTPSFGKRKKHHIQVMRVHDTRPTEKTRSMIMKTIISALLALSVLTSVGTSAYAFDANTFYQQQDREHY